MCVKLSLVRPSIQLDLKYKNSRYSPARNSFTEIPWSRIFSIKINISNKLQMGCQWCKLRWIPASGSVRISLTEKTSADKILGKKIENSILVNVEKRLQKSPHMSEHIPAFSHHDLNSTIKFSGSIFYYCEIWTQKIQAIIIRLRNKSHLESPNVSLPSLKTTIFVIQLDIIVEGWKFKLQWNRHGISRGIF